MTDTLISRDDTPAMARSFVPGHITGIFRIFDDEENPLHRGSTGAGFSVDIGTFTTVKMVEHTSMEITIKYNEKQIDAQVTEAVVRRLAEVYDRTLKVEVEHDSMLPSGVGFGASGAGALGTAIALSHLLDKTLTLEQAASYAHWAEVLNHTGLGDVIAQTKGGTEIRVRPGAPGVGMLSEFPYDESMNVVLAGSPGLQTRTVLTDPDSRRRINTIGAILTERMMTTPTFDNFISCSKEFAEAVGLKTARVTNSLIELEAAGFVNSSMVMLGDSVFSFCNSTDCESVVGILSNYWDTSEVVTTSVSKEGGRLIT